MIFISSFGNSVSSFSSFIAMPGTRISSKWKDGKRQPKKDKAENRSLRHSRLYDLENLVQTHLSRPYLDPNFMATKALRFDPGDAVVSCHNGLYYSATVVRQTRVNAPESIYPKDAVVPPEMLVPVVRLHFDGWSSRLDSEVSENELFDAAFRGRPVDTLALLVAHEWNLLRRDQMGVNDKGLGVSAFLMEDRMYKLVEVAWKEDSRETMSFAQFCGREPGLYYSAA